MNSIFVEMDLNFLNGEYYDEEIGKLNEDYLTDERRISRIRSFLDLVREIRKQNDIKSLRDGEYLSGVIDNNLNLLSGDRTRLHELRQKLLKLYREYGEKCDRIRRGIESEGEMEKLLEYWIDAISNSSLDDDDKEELEKMRFDRIDKLKKIEEKKKNYTKFPCIQSMRIRDLRSISSSRVSKGPPKQQVGIIIYWFEESLTNGEFDSRRRDHITKILLDNYENIDLDIVWDKWVRCLSDVQINEKYDNVKMRRTSYDVICMIEEYLNVRDISRKRLPMRPDYKGPKGYPFIHANVERKIFDFIIPDYVAPMGEVFDQIKNTDLVIEEYKKSLYVSINQINVEKIRKKILDDMLKLDSVLEKKEYLNMVMKVLVTREKEDVNGIFDLFDFEY
jgi:hypothetical protein